jgi:aspartyl-tRNA(Asn)/glutamyl-tRNA(Gln) amidotransferase subunit A
MNGVELLSRIHAHEHLHAFIAVAGEPGQGGAVAVKDLIDVQGFATTGGGAVLPTAPATSDAPLVRRIREAGNWIVGKTNLYEWAYGCAGTNPYFGDVVNPRDRTRTAGGSSSGSAAAVGAGLCDWAVGTDTAGSIRIPASLCGVVGYKPTFGTVDTQGVIPLSRSLDTVGAIAPTVRAAAAGVAMMSGATVAPEQPTGKPLRLTIPEGWIEGLDAETSRVWREVSAGLPSIALPDRAAMAEVMAAIQPPESAAFHREWLSQWPYRYSEDLRQKLQRGLGVAAVDYLRAQEEQLRMRSLVEEALLDWDALILPATAVVAPPVHAAEVREPLLRFTRPFSVTGHPVIVIPAPTQGLPVGIQVVGRHGRDAELIQVASVLERDWATVPRFPAMRANGRV